MKQSCSNRTIVQRKLRASLVCVAFLGVLLFGHEARAQTISTVTPLSFGQIAIKDYSSVGRVTIQSGGSYTYNSNVYIHTPPTRGEYSIVGGPPNTIYTVLMTPTSMPIPGPGGPFTLDNLAVEPALLITDAAGADTFYIIGRLQTLGGGTPYGDGTYTTSFLVTVNF